MTTAVYTAITGGYDALMPHPHIPGVDFICFTDDTGLVCDGWEMVALPDSPDPPRMRAKFPKVLGPQRELADYRYTIWVDGNEEILVPSFVDEALADLGPDGFALHAHPARTCIYDEAIASLNVAQKYDGQPILAQAQHYREQGHPDHWGLWQCGVLARRRSDRLDAAMVDWMGEILNWTVQDQISLPPVMRRHGITPVDFPHNHNASPWVRIASHARSG